MDGRCNRRALEIEQQATVESQPPASTRDSDCDGADRPAKRVKFAREVKSRDGDNFAAAEKFVAFRQHAATARRERREMKSKSSSLHGAGAQRPLSLVVDAERQDAPMSGAINI
jgi:hypothetical protein